jgi:hypothetical protein
LAMSATTRSCLLAAVGASERTRGALLSSENGLGMRVSRKQACERRLPGVRGCGYFLMRSDQQLKEQG